MSDKTSKDKPPEMVTLCNSKFLPNEPWPEEMFGEIETQMREIQANANQQPSVQPQAAAPPGSPTDDSN